MFGLNGTPGLVELVNGSASHDECLQRAPNVPLDLVSSSADSCDDILTNSAADIVQALQTYLHNCDLMIVDLPAASEPDQVVALAQHLDCVVVVIESEKTQTVAADRLLRRLSESNTQVIGVVLNKTRRYFPKVLQRLIAPQSEWHSN
jgi:Mrp family chromosome partitioning ATPase